MEDARQHEFDVYEDVALPTEDCIGAAVVRVAGGSVTLVQGSEETEVVPPDCVRRSALLLDILATSSQLPEDVTVPVSVGAFRVWIQHVSKSGTSATKQRACSGVSDSSDIPRESGMKQQHLDGLLGLFKTADVLIDELTKTGASARLAAAMHSCKGNAEQLLDQVTAQLPEHLLLETLSHVPLPHCLLHLPRSVHPLAIRAHHPSTDATQSLSLTNLHPEAAQAAVSATATLTHLHSLSFSGSTLPSECSAHGALDWFRPLASLRGLTALDLSDAGLGCNTMIALSHVLPGLPLLAALDLSENVIDFDVMEVCATTFQLCSRLERLSLRNAFFATKDGYNAIIMLARHATDLTGLTCLSVGGQDHLHSSDLTERWAQAPHDLLRSLTCMKRLRELSMDFHACITPHHAPQIARSMAELTQLVSLCYTVPAVSDAYPVDGEDYSSLVGPAWAEVAGGAAKLTQLTALELCFDADDSHSRRPWLGALPPLTGLRSLSVAGSGGFSGCASELAELLAAMRSLTSLQIHDESRSNSEEFEAVAMAACVQPSLRRLHLPLSTQQNSGACRDALLRATHLEQLALDMHVAAPQGTDASQADIAPWIPLVSFATRLCCVVHAADAWAAPLVAAVAAHSTLRSMRVLSFATSERGVLGALLEAAAGLPSLLELELGLAPGACSDLDIALPSFSHALRHFVHPGLTSLQLTAPATDIADARPGGGGGDAVALTALRRLRCMGAAEALQVCMPALPQLPLHTLEVGIVLLADVALLRELLGHVPHVRKLRVLRASYPADEALTALMRDMPAYTELVVGRIDFALERHMHMV